MTELSVLTKVPSQYVEERAFKSGRYESERRKSSVLLEFCTFKKIENGMLGVRAGVWAREPVKSGKGLGQLQGCPRRQDHPTGEAAPESGVCTLPSDWSVRHSVLQLESQNGEAGTGAKPGSRTDTYVLAEVLVGDQGVTAGSAFTETVASRLGKESGQSEASG